jgi:hypothetical protein
LHKGEEDYELLIDWIGDSDTESNRLFWVNTEKSLKYLYKGDLSEIDENSLNSFVREVQTGQIAAYDEKTANSEK